MKRSISILLFFFLPVITLLSQNYSSKNNYTGAWELPDSWEPRWAVPEAGVNNHDITINGYITANGACSFSGSSRLIVKDTLVIKGNLTINDNNKVKIEDKGILIVWGNLTVSENAQIEANGYFIVTGDIIKVGDITRGEFLSNDNPVKVFIGGIIPSGLTDDNPQYKALNCTAPKTTPYPNSACSYGNMADITDAPIYSFFQSTCTTTTPTITSGGSTTFCAGGSVTLTSSAETSYLWSTGATTSSINVTTSGNYTVQVTDASGCQSALSMATVITVHALPATPTITAGGPTTFCAGGSVSLNASAGSTYLWSTGATTASINATLSGSFAVQVTNASGCQSASSVATIVTVNALPATPTITAGGPTTFCAGSSVMLTSSAGSSYLWSTGDATPFINASNAGSYTVQVTNTNGCRSAASAPAITTVNSLPVVNAGTDVVIPNGTNTTINASVTGTGPFAYSWSPSGQLINAFIEDPTTVNLATTTVYTLTATSATTSCSNTDEVTVTISGGSLSSTPTANPAIVCAGANIQLHALASGGSGSYTYTWTSTPVGFTSSAANPIVNPTVNTTYHIAVSDGFNTVNSQIAVIVNALPATATIATGGPTTFCTGGSVTLTSSAGSTYLWSSGATTPGINVTASGSYTVQVTNASGCLSASSAATIVTVNGLPATPTITAGGPTTFCDGGSVTLTASAGSTYLWSSGATTASINATEAGSYSVQVTNAGGCQSASSVVTIITVNALPATPTITASGPTTFCTGGSVLLTSSAGSIYLWSTGETSQGITATTSGSYTVQVVNENGCQSPPSAASIIEVNALPAVNITSSSSTMCTDDLRTLTGSPAGGTFIISHGPATLAGNVLTATGTGIIDLEYNYTAVCSNKATQSIIVAEKPEAFAGPDQELKFVFETQMHAELSSPETGEWSLISGSGLMDDPFSPTTSVTHLSLGDNVFLWSVRNGSCEASAEVRITVYDLFVPSVITPNGDGKNDYFIISENTSPVELIIFNRWGNIEYTNDNYENDWSGKNNNGAELTGDTYFYVLKFENGIIRKGSVLIKR